jgi:hypothetical protein
MKASGRNRPCRESKYAGSEPSHSGAHTQVDDLSSCTCLLGCLGNPRCSCASQRMSTADTSDSLFESIAPGSSAKAVVRLDSVKGEELKGTLLEKQSDTVYRVPFRRTVAVIAVLTPDASVVMGKPQDIAVGAVVQLAGTIDASHILQTNQVVILTGYVRLSQKAG